MVTVDMSDDVIVDPVVLATLSLEGKTGDGSFSAESASFALFDLDLRDL